MQYSNDYLRQQNTRKTSTGSYDPLFQCGNGYPNPLDITTAQGYNENFANNPYTKQMATTPTEDLKLVKINCTINYFLFIKFEWISLFSKMQKVDSKKAVVLVCLLSKHYTL